MTDDAIEARRTEVEVVLVTLVDRAQQGDKEAFDTLAQLVGDRCMAIAYRILRDTDLAADAVQAALVTAWRDLPALRDRDRFEPWLYRLLVRICYADAKRRRRFVPNVIGFPETGSDRRDAILTVDDREQLERGFRRLSPEQRAVLVFVYYLGFSVTDTAEQLGIPVGTAKSRLRLGMAALRGALEADARIPAHSKERPA
jgi:RNA polymerase sigma-70 factor, ECF subfamily